jgi:single-stranded-DNA-specific exonuclease
VEGRSSDLEGDIILSGDQGWHPGVIGVVASKLVEKYGKPAILISYANGKGRGSCRSVPGFDIYQALSQCADLLETFGGHASAGGLMIQRTAVDAFKQKMSGHLKEAMPDAVFRARLKIDCEVHLSALSHRLLSQIDQLRPFGEGNPVPVLATSGIQLARPAQQVGRNADHLSFFVRQGGHRLKAIAFSRGADMERLNSTPSFTLAYTPKMNFFSGRPSIELEIKDILFE